VKLEPSAASLICPAVSAELLGRDACGLAECALCKSCISEQGCSKFRNSSDLAMFEVASSLTRSALVRKSRSKLGERSSAWHAEAAACDCGEAGMHSIVAIQHII